MHKKPRLVPGEVTREFIYELFEAAIEAIVNSSQAKALAIDNFRKEVENNYEIAKTPDSNDE